MLSVLTSLASTKNDCVTSNGPVLLIGSVNNATEPGATGPSSDASWKYRSRFSSRRGSRCSNICFMDQERDCEPTGIFTIPQELSKGIDGWGAKRVSGR